MSEILEILHDIKDRIETQIADVDAGVVVVVGTSAPILDNLKYRQLLELQMMDLEDAIRLLLGDTTARYATRKVVR
jgi:hypothetical protein